MRRKLKMVDVAYRLTDLASPPGNRLEALKGGGEATLKVAADVGLYILNEKRAHLARLQSSLGLYVTVQIDPLAAHADCQIERTSMETRPDHAPVAAPVD